VRKVRQVWFPKLDNPVCKIDTPILARQTLRENFDFKENLRNLEELG
jgi:hypothetical protein